MDTGTGEAAVQGGWTSVGSMATTASDLIHLSFIAPHAGTYAYHCHVDTVLHFEMGMYGTVIVRPPDGTRGPAWAGGPTFDREYVWHLHTFDSSWHNETVSSANSPPPPGLLHDQWSGWADTLSDPTIAITGAPEWVLIRANNMGYQPALVRLGGLEFQVIASDGRPLPSPVHTTERLVAPGERYDILVHLPESGTWNADVDYFDIRLARVLGTARTSITSR